jgi:hypothetical protein
LPNPSPNHPPNVNPFYNFQFPSNPSSPSMLRNVKKQKTCEGTATSEGVKLAVNLLEDEFRLREIASQEFPPDIPSTHIRSSVSKYENEMSAASQRSICCSCGKFFAGHIYQIDNEDNFIQTHQDNLDRCGYHENAWIFCNLCYAAIKRNNPPKFSAENSINVTMCQHYPSALEDLTPIEEYLIAKCHPIGTILKLRPGGRASPTNYNALRGHMIVIPQDPGPLLHILPSPELRLHNIIKVFWLGKNPPMSTDLKPFLSVRKDKVLAALYYLVQNNGLYRDITINHTMIGSWPDEFIPPEVVDNITHLENPDHHEREGYTVSLQSGNYENDLHAAQDGAFDADNNSPFVTGSVYTDVNGERTDPNLRLIDALLGVVTNNSSLIDETTQAADDSEYRGHGHGQNHLPTISYAIHGQATLMSGWENPHYFTGAFPTLFPSGHGGHLDKRPIPVSLTAFAQWALSHHSRRSNSLSNIIKLY